MQLSDPALKNMSHRLQTAVVSEANLDDFTVVDSQLRHARRAASCLVRPKVGDVVLVALGEDANWIVCVLVAAGGCEVLLEGSVVSLRAQQVHVVTQELCTTSSVWHARHASLRLVASQLVARVADLEWLGGRISAAFNLLFMRGKKSFREISEFESVQSANYHVQVQDSLVLSSRTGILTAQELIKIDAQQVQMG